VSTRKSGAARSPTPTTPPPWIGGCGYEADMCAAVPKAGTCTARTIAMQRIYTRGRRYPRSRLCGCPQPGEGGQGHDATGALLRGGEGQQGLSVVELGRVALSSSERLSAATITCSSVDNQQGEAEATFGSSDCHHQLLLCFSEIRKDCTGRMAPRYSASAFF
jgi:hypothetical protein